GAQVRAIGGDRFRGWRKIHHIAHVVLVAMSDLRLASRDVEGTIARDGGQEAKARSERGIEHGLSIPKLDEHVLDDVLRGFASLEDTHGDAQKYRRDLAIERAERGAVLTRHSLQQALDRLVFHSGSALRKGWDFAAAYRGGAKVRGTS